MCEEHDGQGDGDDHHHQLESTAASTDVAGIGFSVADSTRGHCVGIVHSALEQALSGAEVAFDAHARRVSVADATIAAEAIRAGGNTREPVAL